MHKSSLKPFLALCVAAAGTAVFAAAPTVSVPTIVISDIENNDATLDNNLFVFTDAFIFSDLAADGDAGSTATDNALLRWTFFVDSGNAANTGSITINGKSTLATLAEGTNPVDPINFSSAPFDIGNVNDMATFLEDTLSPGGGAGAPHANPTPITAQQGAPADVDNDSNADTLVGELAVTFIVSDPTSQLTGTSNTFVYTYDTVPFGSSVVEDGTIGGIPFVDVPLDDSNPSAPDGAIDGWGFRTWSDRFASPASFITNWLEDSTSSVTRGVQASLNITGAGTGTLNGSFASSNAEWVNAGNPEADFAAGTVYAERATVAINNAKTGADSFRIALQQNETSINQTYVLNAADTVDLGSGAIDHPFLPATSTPRAYLSTHDPLDGDTALTTLPYLVGYDLIDVIGDGTITVALSKFEIGAGDATAFNVNEVANPTGGAFAGTGGAAFDGSDNANYDGWDITSTGVVPIPLVGGTTILRDPQSTTVSAASISTVISSPTAPLDGADVAYVEYSNFAGDVVGPTVDLDVVEVAADSSYRIDYTLQVASGAADSNTPDFRLRAAYPIPTFSIEFAVTSNRGSLFPSENTDAVASLNFTAPPQFSSSDPGVVGQENDLQFTFSPLDLAFTDGTVTMNQTRLQLLGANDPNIDY
jgi:hypothetical protein